MKKKLFSTLAVLSLVMIMSSNQTKSQRQQSQDTVPDPEPVAAPLKESVSIDKLLDSLDVKINKANDIVEKGSQRSDRVEGKADNLRVRQAKIRLALTPIKIKPVEIKPRPFQELSITTDSVIIKPIEPEKKSWWERRFKMN